MITAEQRLLRADKIGSSDAAAILGLDPYRSAADVWLEKTGQADGFGGNEHTERGNLLEPAVRLWAGAKLGKLMHSDVNCVHPSRLLAANLDAAVYDSIGRSVVEIVEVKTTVNCDEWGEAGTDQVPERVLVQVHHQFACVPSATVAWVPVLMPGFQSFDFRMYRVERNDDLARMVERAGLDFMRRHVIPGVRPDDFKPSLEVLRRVRREPNKTVPVDDAVLDNYVTARAAKKQAEEIYERAQADLIAALGDAERGEGTAVVVTYMTTKRRGYTVAETECRHLRTKKKGAK